MDLQKILDGAVAKQRADRMATSEQLTLGELVSKLEACEMLAHKRARFDFGGFVPTGIDIWRGSYAELSLHFGEGDGPIAADFTNQLKAVIGKTLEGYKGGDFLMSRHTPLWVANWGESGCDKYRGDKEYPYVAVVGVDDGPDVVTIITAEQEY